MYLIVMDARTSEVLLSVPTSAARLSRERQATRKQLELIYPTRVIISPLQRMRITERLQADNVHALLTVYKSQRAAGNARAAGTAVETWAVL